MIHNHEHIIHMFMLSILFLSIGVPLKLEPLILIAFILGVPLPFLYIVNGLWVNNTEVKT